MDLCFDDGCVCVSVEEVRLALVLVFLAGARLLPFLTDELPFGWHDPTVPVFDCGLRCVGV